MRTYAEIIDAASTILEDTGNAIFADATLAVHISNGLATMARYKPYQSKETRLLAVGSKEVNVQDVPNLINVLKAEYEISQNPPAYRNVTWWGDNIEIGTDANPAALDKVVLYCEKSHTLVAAPSTLAGAVNNNPGPYAVGATSIVLDGLGTGAIKQDTLVYFTGIAGEYRVTADVSIVANAATIAILPGLLEALPDNTIVTFKVSTLSPDLERILPELVAGNAALNWVGAGRTQITTAVTKLAAADASIAAMTTDITAVITEIGLVKSNLGLMKTAVDAALGQVDVRVDQAVADIGNARTAFNATEAAVSADIALIAARITAALDDLTAGRALINTITTGSAPQSQRAQYASGELNNAAAIINEARTHMQQGSNLANQLYNAANHELNVSGSYAAEGRALESEYAALVANYGANATRLLGVVNADLSQAHGYISAINSRLSVANIVMSYQRWGQMKIDMAIQELRAMVQPKVYTPYSRS